MATLVADPPIQITKAMHGDPPLIHKKMSWDEYMALPPKPKAEWINGEAIIMMAPARIIHNSVADNIFVLLRLALSGVKVYRETGFLVSNGARVPDIIVVAHKPTDEIWVTTPPLIVVEVLSKSTRRQDLVTKAAEYAKAGASQYWIADPDAEWLEVKENHDGQWRSVATLNATNTKVAVAVGTHGIVHLEFSKIFD